MLKTFSLLLNSRKAWAATFSSLGVAVAVYLRTKDLIPADAFLPTVLALGGLGSVFIGGTAMEDAAKHSSLKVAGLHKAAEKENPTPAATAEKENSTPSSVAPSVDA